MKHGCYRLKQPLERQILVFLGFLCGILPGLFLMFWFMEHPPQNEEPDPNETLGEYIHRTKDCFQSGCRVMAGCYRCSRAQECRPSDAPECFGSLCNTCKWFDGIRCTHEPDLPACFGQHPTSVFKVGKCYSCECEQHCIAQTRLNEEVEENTWT